VTEDWSGQEGAGPLRALGQVEPPGPGVLDAAREALWSAVAEEMLSAGPAGRAGRADAGRAGAPGTDQSREGVRRHRGESGS
jgi:hypothetical protein